MPIYDYHCDHCGHAFSAVQRFADDAIAACPSCGKPPRRLLSNPALVFKGSGWYKTDSRGPDKRGTSDKSATGDKGDAAAATTTSGVAQGSAEGPEKATKTDPSTAGSDVPATTPAKKPEKAAPVSS